jgi:PqqD family protein of HPr-rel-A system
MISEPATLGRWLVPRARVLRLRTWEDEGVAYDHASGSVHLLGRLACDILEILQRTPDGLSSSELAGVIAHHHGIEADAELTAAVQSALSALQQVELVRFDATSR